MVGNGGVEFAFATCVQSVEVDDLNTVYVGVAMPVWFLIQTLQKLLKMLNLFEWDGTLRFTDSLMSTLSSHQAEVY